MFKRNHILFLFVLVCLWACTRDQIEPDTESCDEQITYTNHVKEIIDKSCAYSGCHLDSAPGNYSTYSGLEGALTNGTFKQRVINQVDMPPVYAENGPTSLTADELKLINCWINDGYTE